MLKLKNKKKKKVSKHRKGEENIWCILKRIPSRLPGDVWPCDRLLSYPGCILDCSWDRLQ